MPLDYLPILILMVVAVGFGIIGLAAPYFLGPRNPTAVKFRHIRVW